ncbi:MAG: hypothetical protein J0L66_07445 [Cytophagales bacterium]|nr:hypothetical protein [Cytophagales bacterium]
MKKLIYALVALAAVACSSPKYTASFSPVNSSVPYYAATTELPAPVKQDELLASTADTPVLLATEPATTEAIAKTYGQMSKAERKNLRQQMRTELKELVKAQKEMKKMGAEASAAKKGIDHDLKLAAIFGAVGIVALIISGQVFYIIGGIALIIGVVFFVKWLVRQ